MRLTARTCPSCYVPQAEEKAKETAAQQAAAKQRAEIKARTDARRAELRELRLQVDPADMPAASRRHHALREKQKCVPWRVVWCVMMGCRQGVALR